MPGQVPKHVVQERYERLIALQDEISWTAARELVGREVEVLVSTIDGRKDVSTGRVSGRARDGRLVHLAGHAQPGDVVTAEVTYAAPHHLVADGGITSHRRWRGAATASAHPVRSQLLTIGSRPV
jgi:tRNA-2-methylthio-N6-dimethylallyladenosine synthase